MSGVLRWEEPPAALSCRRETAPRRHAHWVAVAEQLRGRPGEWGVVIEADSFNQVGGIASQIKSGKMIAFRPAGTFEVTTRSSGVCTVYARYIGEGS